MGTPTQSIAASKGKVLSYFPWRSHHLKVVALFYSLQEKITGAVTINVYSDQQVGVAHLCMSGCDGLLNFGLLAGLILVLLVRDLVTQYSNQSLHDSRDTDL